MDVYELRFKSSVSVMMGHNCYYERINNFNGGYLPPFWLSAPFIDQSLLLVLIIISRKHKPNLDPTWFYIPLIIT